MPSLFRVIGNIFTKLQSSQENSTIKFGLELENKLVPFIYQIEKPWFEFLYSIRSSLFIKKGHHKILTNIVNDTVQFERMDEFLLPSFGRFFNINFILYEATSSLKPGKNILLLGFSYNPKNTKFAQIIRQTTKQKYDYTFYGFHELSINNIKTEIATQPQNPSNLCSPYNILFNTDIPYTSFTSTNDTTQHFNVLTSLKPIVNELSKSNTIINSKIRVVEGIPYIYIYDISKTNRITNSESGIKVLEKQHILNNVSTLEDVSMVETFSVEPISYIFVLDEKTEELNKIVLKELLNPLRNKIPLTTISCISKYIETNPFVNDVQDSKQNREIINHLEKLHIKLITSHKEKEESNIYPNVFDIDFKQKLYSLPGFVFNERFNGNKKLNHRDIIYHEFYDESGSHSYIKSIIIAYYPNTKTYTIQHIDTNNQKGKDRNIYPNIEEKYLHKTAHLHQHQQFLKNYMSPLTPYNSILLFHKPGSGKTLSSLSIAESFKEHIHQQGKKIHIICPTRIRKEFLSTIFPESLLTTVALEKIKSMDNPRNKNAKWLIQQNYLLELLKQFGSKDIQFSNFHENHKQLFKILKESIYEYHPRVQTITIGKYYNIYTPDGFNSFILNLYKNNTYDDFEKQIIDIFEDSMIIIDEAHHYKSVISTIHYNSNFKKEGGGNLENVTDGVLKKEWGNQLDIVIHILKLYKKQTKLILLSGTPYVNDEKDIYDLLNLMIINDGAYYKEPLYHINKYSPVDFNNKNHSLITSNFVRSIQGRISYFNDNKEMPIQLHPDDIYFNYPIYESSFCIEHGYSNTNKLQLPVIYPSSPSNKIITIVEMFLNNTKRQCYLVCSKDEFKKFKNNSNIKYLNEQINILPKNVEIHVLPSELNNTKIMLLIQSIVHIDTLILFYSKNKSIAINTGWQTKWLKTVFEKCNRYLPAPNNSIICSNKLNNFIHISKQFPPIICTHMKHNEIWEREKKNANITDKIIGVPHPYNEEHPKIDTMIEIIKYSNSKVFIYTSQKNIHNARDTQSSTFLDYLKNKIQKVIKGRNITCLSGSVPPIVFDSSIKLFNESTSNDILIGTRILMEGISLRGISQVHILEPWWNNSRLNQIFARAIRLDSHNSLLKKFQNVLCFLHVSLPPKNIIEQGKKYNTIDLRMVEVSSDKNIGAIFLEKIIQKNAVDCVFNQHQSKWIKIQNYEILDKFEIKAMSGFYNYSPNCFYEKCDNMSCAHTISDDRTFTTVKKQHVLFPTSKENMDVEIKWFINQIKTYFLTSETLPMLTYKELLNQIYPYSGSSDSILLGVPLQLAINFNDYFLKMKFFKNTPIYNIDALLQWCTIHSKKKKLVRAWTNRSLSEDINNNTDKDISIKIKFKEELKKHILNNIFIIQHVWIVTRHHTIREGGGYTLQIHPHFLLKNIVQTTLLDKCQLSNDELQQVSKYTNINILKIKHIFTKLYSIIKNINNNNVNNIFRYLCYIQNFIPPKIIKMNLIWNRLYLLCKKYFIRDSVMNLIKHSEVQNILCNENIITDTLLLNFSKTIRTIRARLHYYNVQYRKYPNNNWKILDKLFGNSQIYDNELTCIKIQNIHNSALYYALQTIIKSRQQITLINGQNAILVYKKPFYTVQIVNSTDIDEISLPLNYNINFYNECFINENRNVIHNIKSSLDESDNIQSLQKLKIVIPEEIEYSEDLVNKLIKDKMIKPQRIFLEKLFLEQSSPFYLFFQNVTSSQMKKYIMEFIIDSLPREYQRCLLIYFSKKNMDTNMDKTMEMIINALYYRVHHKCHETCQPERKIAYYVKLPHYPRKGDTCTIEYMKSSIKANNTKLIINHTPPCITSDWNFVNNTLSPFFIKHHYIDEKNINKFKTICFNGIYWKHKLSQLNILDNMQMRTSRKGYSIEKVSIETMTPIYDYILYKNPIKIQKNIAVFIPKQHPNTMGILHDFNNNSGNIIYSSEDYNTTQIIDEQHTTKNNDDEITEMTYILNNSEIEDARKLYYKEVLFYLFNQQLISPFKNYLDYWIDNFQQTNITDSKHVLKDCLPGSGSFHQKLIKFIHTVAFKEAKLFLRYFYPEGIHPVTKTNFFPLA